jgi:2-hydroxychromene-2-carboxylate isomerase
MPTRIDFYFDFVSPYSYLASTVLPRLAAEHSASIRYRPFGLVELMRRVGNRPTTLECRNKFAYAIADLGRWAGSYGVAFTPTPHFDGIDFALLGRGALVAIDEGRGADYVEAVYAAVWADSVDLGRRSELVAVLDRAGLNGARLLERAGAESYGEKLAANTAEAAERGVFGSPTIFIGDEMFFGNDRFGFVADALRAAA